MAVTAALGSMLRILWRSKAKGWVSEKEPKAVHGDEGFLALREEKCMVVFAKIENLKLDRMHNCQKEATKNQENPLFSREWGFTIWNLCGIINYASKEYSEGTYEKDFLGVLSIVGFAALFLRGWRSLSTTADHCGFRRGDAGADRGKHCYFRHDECCVHHRHRSRGLFHKGAGLHSKNGDCTDNDQAAVRLHRGRHRNAGLHRSAWRGSGRL